jgi:eukaryotic-like serine/threonine-protein kinase
MTPIESAIPEGRQPAGMSPLSGTAVVPAELPATGVQPIRIEMTGFEVDSSGRAHAGAKSIDDDWFPSTPTFPALGTEFLGFRLVEELGRGAFGRVYLAHQGTLAGRPVALKLACDIAGESRTLAQLQHTNIVPIYSFHRSGPFQAVCMPYFGRTTLAQVVESLSGRASLPSSGRELKSTINRSTVLAPPTDSSPVSRPASPAAPQSPEPHRESNPGHACDPAGWAKLEELSFVGAVLWLGEQLADGLAHAHNRGILHRDLKPANVLLADDGRPMLLDFNLAEDTKLRDPFKRVAIGGTLPYMSPEYLMSYRDQVGGADERCDIFSLGVILFELLTGRHPFRIYRSGNHSETLERSIAERRQPPPFLATRNPLVSPAVEAIVRKCLAPNPDDRYQRAEHLREDLDRQLNNLPLKYAGNPSIRERARKWVRRHPRLTSTGSVAAVAAVLLVALGLGAVHSREQARDLHARTQFVDHRAALRDVQLILADRHLSRPSLDGSLEKLRGILVRYEVPEDQTDDRWLAAPDIARLPEPDIARLRADIGETFYQMAEIAHLKATWYGSENSRETQLELAMKWNAAAARYGADRIPRAIREQQAALAEVSGDAVAADRLRAEAAAIPLVAPRDLFHLGAGLAQRGHPREALPHLQKSTQLDPGDFAAWFVRGGVHHLLGQDEMAAMCYASCLALRDDFAPAWLNRGQSFSQLRFYDLAADDFEKVIRLEPKSAAAYVQRAGVREARGNLKDAEADYTLALETGNAPVRVYFLRADVRARLKDEAGAKADREKGLSLTPTDELSWVGRGETRLADDPKGALADAEEALKLNPSFVFALQLKAHILAERLKRPGDAEKVLDRAVELNADYVPARAGRGVLLARRGKRDEAIRDAKDALMRDTLAPNLYQVACIYALTSAVDKGHSEDKTEAFRLLWLSLKTGFGLDIVDTDTDLDPLRKDPEFKRVVTAARAYYEASKR